MTLYDWKEKTLRRISARADREFDRAIFAKRHSLYKRDDFEIAGSRLYKALSILFNRIDLRYIELDRLLRTFGKSSIMRSVGIVEETIDWSSHEIDFREFSASELRGWPSLQCRIRQAKKYISRFLKRIFGYLSWRFKRSRADIFLGSRDDNVSFYGMIILMISALPIVLVYMLGIVPSRGTLAHDIFIALHASVVDIILLVVILSIFISENKKRENRKALDRHLLLNHGRQGAEISQELVALLRNVHIQDGHLRNSETMYGARIVHDEKEMNIFGFSGYLCIKGCDVEGLNILGVNELHIGREHIPDCLDATAYDKKETSISDINIIWIISYNNLFNKVHVKRIRMLYAYFPSYIDGLSMVAINSVFIGGYIYKMEARCRSFVKSEFHSLTIENSKFEDCLFEKCVFTDLTIINTEFLRCRFVGCVFSARDVYSGFLTRESSIRSMGEPSGDFRARRRKIIKKVYGGSLTSFVDDLSIIDGKRLVDVAEKMKRRVAFGVRDVWLGGVPKSEGDKGEFHRERLIKRRAAQIAQHRSTMDLLNRMRSGEAEQDEW